MNVDAAEVARFEALAERWWDPNGEFRPLHDINALRVGYIAERSPVAASRVLDMGCGGGLLAEALCALGGEVTGVDAGEAALAVARLHAQQSGLDIRYEQGSPESFAESGAGQYRVVACLETLEHVPDVPSSVAALAALTSPGGDVFLATINRTPKAFALAIVGAEYLLGLLPKGTHRYRMLIRPAELSRACRDAGLRVVDIIGVDYNPLNRRCRLTSDVGVNYMLHARKA